MKAKIGIIILIAVWFLVGSGVGDAYAGEQYNYNDFILPALPDWTDKYAGSNKGDMSYFKISALVETLKLTRLQAVELQNHFRDLTAEGMKSQKAFEEALNRVRTFQFESGLDPAKLDAAPFIVVFDMDETLLQQYSSKKECPKKYYQVKFAEGVRCVSMAPAWEKMMKTVKELDGLVVIFSANVDDVVWKIFNTVTIDDKKVSEYVDGIMTNSYLILQGKDEWVSGKKRGDPVVVPSKDLRFLDETLEKVIIIDDNPGRIIQDYNLRLPGKYRSRRYYTDKLARMAYDKQLPEVAAEIVESVEYAKKKGIPFVQAYLPYSQLGQVSLNWLVDTGTFTRTAAIEYIRRYPDIVDKKF
jgi:hypothetical protein